MKKRTRRIIFSVAVIIFLILSFFVVLFALGYKYDFVKNKFFKTGSFEVKTNIKAEVYVNDELAGATSFLTHSFSLGLLLPRTYSVRAQSDNYQTWQKLVRVEAGLLTSFPHVVLLPEEFDEEVVASSSLGGIALVRFDPEGKRVLVGNQKTVEAISLDNGEKELLKSSVALLGLQKSKKLDYIESPDGGKEAFFNNNELWVEWLKDTDYQPYKKSGTKELITRFSQNIQDVQWYKDSDHLIADVGGVVKFIEIDNRDGINIFDIETTRGKFYYNSASNSIYKFEGNLLTKISLK